MVLREKGSRTHEALALCSLICGDEFGADKTAVSEPHRMDTHTVINTELQGGDSKHDAEAQI